MYYRDHETKAGAKAEHNKRQKSTAADRLKSVKARKKAAKA